MINGKSICSIDGVKIAYRYRKAKTQTVFVFLHGIGGNSSAWVPILEHYERMGVSTLYMDVRGHGKSGKPRNKRYYRLETCCLDLREILKKEGIKKAVLIGHSSGGALAQNFELLYPEYVSAMVLITSFYTNPLKYYALPLQPFTIPIKFVLSLIGLLARILPRYKLKYTAYYNYRDSSEFYLFWKDILGTPIEVMVYHLLVLLDFDNFEHIKRLDKPVLIVAGKKDWITKLEGSRKMHKLIKNSSLKIIDDTEHDLLFKQPSRICKAIDNFIKQRRLGR